ncbi:MAG: hypothetical protein K2G70_04520 [Turicibacter sp.]|nr:hypothetical protein [Turicibacter sp.]
MIEIVAPSTSEVAISNNQENIYLQVISQATNESRESEEKNSSLNEEVHDEIESSDNKESQDSSFTEPSSTTMTEEDALKVEKALEHLKTALLQSQSESLHETSHQSNVSNQAFKTYPLEDEAIKVSALSYEGESEKVVPLSSTVDEDLEDETDLVFKDFRQTFYSVTAGEVQVGYGLTYLDDAVKIIDNVMHYYDDEYEWIPIVAVNIDEILELGLNEQGIPSYYGTILEITYPEGLTQHAIVLDACGACSWDNRIDLWVYDHDYQHDILGIEYRIVRKGFSEDDE